MTTSDLTIAEAPHGTAPYKEAIALRELILRKPLGLGFSEEEIAGEKGQLHIVAVLNGRVVGNVTLIPDLSGTIKLRQMAIAPEVQGQKIGQRLVQFAENMALAKGYSAIELHARETAIRFYEKMGYTAFGERYTEVTIPHQSMRKTLSSLKQHL